MPIRVVIRGAEESVKKLDGMRARLRLALIQAMQDSTIMVQSLAKENAPVFRGLLRESILQVVQGRGDAIVGKVGSALVYAPIVEFGRTAGWFPNVGELRIWARRKLGDPRLAYVVGRAIQRRGFRAQPYLGPAAREAAPRIELAFANRLNQVIQAEGGTP